MVDAIEGPPSSRGDDVTMVGGRLLAVVLNAAPDDALRRP